MSEKSDSKRKFIIEKATEVFASKGFRSVTMKDIVEACQISRGGLYLYYSSTEEIFKEVCQAADEADADQKDISEFLSNAKASELLLWFIKEQKKAILKRKLSLTAAKYEYAFYKKQNGDSKEAKNEFDTAVKVLTNILMRGNDDGEFDCMDPDATALSMMYAIEGMKACGASFGLSEKKVDGELLYLMSQFVES